VNIPPQDRWENNGFVSRELIKLKKEGKTQKERVTYVLFFADGAWVCGEAFLGGYIPTYSQRVGDLIKEGFPIARSTCSNKLHHHDSSIGSYRWDFSMKGTVNA